jgi:hypothetical protein
LLATIVESDGQQPGVAVVGGIGRGTGDSQEVAGRIGGDEIRYGY